MFSVINNNNLLFRAQKCTLDKIHSKRKINNKKNEHSHLEIAEANRAKWLGQAEKNIAIKLQSIKKTGHDFHSHTHNKKNEKWMCTQK